MQSTMDTFGWPSCHTLHTRHSQVARGPVRHAPRASPLVVPAHGCSRQPQRVRQLRRAVAASAGEGASAGPRTHDSLRDPAHIGATSNTQTKVQEVPDLTLDTYMRLPVEQYYELDPNMIKPLGSRQFLLAVPRIQLFNVWLEPVVEVVVRHADGTSKVIIEAVSCQLKGSELIQSMGLDRRFVLNFTTELTWDSPASRTTGGASRGPAPASQQALHHGTIFAQLQLDVWCEVIPPFSLLPRDVLEGTGNAVLSGLVSALLPVFVRKLGSDYERWASEPAYRARRAAHPADDASAAQRQQAVARAP